MRNLGAAFLTVWATYDAIWVLPMLFHPFGFEFSRPLRVFEAGLGLDVIPWVTVAAIILAIAGHLPPRRLFLPLASGYLLLELYWNFAPMLLATRHGPEAYAVRVPSVPELWAYTALLVTLPVLGIIAYRRRGSPVPVQG